MWYYGMLYKVVAHTVILYGSDSWVVTGSMLKVLEGFHHRTDWRIAVITARCAEDGDCEYSPVDYLMA